MNEENHSPGTSDVARRTDGTEYAADTLRDPTETSERVRPTDPLLREIGDTPMVPYEDSSVDGSIRVKCEFDNPTGSMKDRIAYGMIAELESAGELSPEKPIVEASSGNTAGSVALVANRFGYDAVITTPVDNSPQKLGYVEAFGAELVTCPDVGPDDDRYYRTAAERIADERGGVLLDQYSSQSNPQIHAEWTGPELTAQVPEVTHVVCPMGTGGTMSGIAKHVEAYDGSVTTVGVDAARSNIDSAFSEGERGPYDTEIEGLGQREELPTMWFEYVDDVRSVSDEEAFLEARRAAREEGLLLGGSSGAALVVAREIATENPDSTVVAIACDGGEQYFDTVFDDEWMAERGYGTE